MTALTYVSEMPAFVVNFINISGCCGILFLIDIDFFCFKKREEESWKESLTILISTRWQTGPLP